MFHLYKSFTLLQKLSVASNNGRRILDPMQSVSVPNAWFETRALGWRIPGNEQVSTILVLLFSLGGIKQYLRS